MSPPRDLGRPAGAARSIRPSRSRPRRRSRSSVRAIGPGVALVVVAEQVQQSVQGEHPQLGAHGVWPAARRLAGGDAGGNHDVAKRRPLEPWRVRRIAPSGRARIARGRRGGKRQDVGGVIDAAEDCG